MNIAIDIDETLYSFDTEVRETFFELAIEKNDKSLLRGAYSTNHEWRNLTDVLGEDIAYEAILRVHDNTLKQIPFKDSGEVCEKIYNSGYNIKYVSSRRDKYKELTEKWLNYWGFPPGEMICVNDNKKDVITDCIYLIDDRPKTIVEFVTNFKWKNENIGLGQRKAFGLWRDYNRNLTDLDNVYLAPTWKGINYYLKRKGVIDESN